eukprot:2668798-Rhodomonas_salina.1
MSVTALVSMSPSSSVTVSRWVLMSVLNAFVPGVNSSAGSVSRCFCARAMAVSTSLRAMDVPAMELVPAMIMFSASFHASA